MAALEQIMTEQVFTVAPDTPVAAVADAMVKGRISSAIVMSGSWIEGIFTERDALRAAASGKDLTASPISDWMTRDPTTAPPDMDSEEAADIMAANGFRHLPVVRDNELKGIVSLRDVLGARIRR